MTRNGDFDEKTKEIIAKRAGYRCSFPNCNKTLVGPGNTSDGIITIGECAHIFSAVLKGPRTDGGLSNEELKRIENGIYVCRNHHKIIDSKSKENKYTSDLLTQYKNRHEFLISAELGEYMYPLNWINNIKIAGTNIRQELNINLGKVTLFTGDNSTGKSTIIEMLNSCFSQKLFPRWNQPATEFSLEVQLDNPVLSKFKSVIKNNQLTYNIRGENNPFVPYDFFVLHLRDYKGRTKINVKKSDDIKQIATILGLDRNFVKSMLETTNVNSGLKTKSLKIQTKRKTPYPVDKLIVIDKKRKIPFSFCQLSSSEQAELVLDIAISFAKEISKFKPILFLMDWVGIGICADTIIKPYIDYLQSQDAHFQSILVSANSRSQLDWNGWMMAKFKKENGIVKIIQNKK
ncbi:MAG: AAA family ATPase [Candidatus Symbiothrix sp.]|jgi:energy-coupling factor transporter ATP-binding protein EcfA2|nr:AAA family ATPase [Candidatus Symbiothrix sp.]